MTAASGAMRIWNHLSFRAQSRNLVGVVLGFVVARTPIGGRFCDCASLRFAQNDSSGLFVYGP